MFQEMGQNKWIVSDLSFPERKWRKTIRTEKPGESVLSIPYIPQGDTGLFPLVTLLLSFTSHDLLGSPPSYRLKWTGSHLTSL